MFKKILVAFDGSKSSKEALNTSIELAKKFGSVIYLVSVIPQSDFAVLKNEVTSASKEESKFYQELQRETIESNTSKVVIKSTIIYGHPAEKLLDYASSGTFDLIVIGSRGLNATERLFLGSVSDELSHHSSCPILIVK